MHRRLVDAKAKEFDRGRQREKSRTWLIYVYCHRETTHAGVDWTMMKAEYSFLLYTYLEIE